MSRPEPRPPGLSRRVLGWAARRLDVRELIDDAAELFIERARRDGVRPARRWYRLQALAAVGRVVARGGRAARTGLGGPLAGLSLDAKLGVRMLARHPGLTVVGGLAMAFAIFVGASTFALVAFFVAPTPPLPDGDRVVGLRYWDVAENDPAAPLPRDLRAWRGGLRTVESVGAYRMVERNLGEGGGEPVQVARMSPEGFRVARVAPLLGRALAERDEAPGADPVVVLSHRLWRTRLGGDPAVVGSSVRLGGRPATVVGVMPRGFGFPNRPQLWMPLGLNDPAQDRGGEEAPLTVFARLAPGATLEEAQAELAALAPRALAADVPDRPAHLTAEVLPFLESTRSVRMGTVLQLMFYQLNAYAALFLVLVASNVALLLYARALAREKEIAVRSALGAGRGRIVTQLFIEALALCALATAVGLAATGPALEWIRRQTLEMGGDLPYGMQTAVSPTTVLYALPLTLLAAVVAGVLPALKTTGRGVGARLHQAAAGAGAPRLGGIWTGVVVTQIATTVVFTAGAYLMGHQAARAGSLEASFPAERYLGVRLEMDGEAALATGNTDAEGFRERYATHVRELERRLLEDPAVAAVTMTRQLPTKHHPTTLLELDEGGSAAPGPDGATHRVATGAVDLDAFEVLQSPLLAGRGFTERDLDQGVRSVVVNARFVEEVLGGRSAIGRRIRYLDRARPAERAPWHEIVGVVRNLVDDSTRSLDFQERAGARVYHPLDPARAEGYPLHLVAHVRDAPLDLVPTLHGLAEAVSPALRLHEPVTLDWADPGLARGWRLYAELLSIVSAVALLLALSGIYAVMSFTVARRRREIGVRVALGASARRVVPEIFRRPLVQVGTGVGLGCLLVGLGVWALTPGRATVADAGLLLALCLGMLGMCGLACVVPTLRALRVEPAEALTADG